ncbi:MAG: glycoside hydrolase family 5 protein [Bacteroidales bacterium]|nr:glycoside hydrolase family 5 protein [Bacteroidales bacterium]
MKQKLIIALVFSILIMGCKTEEKKSETAKQSFSLRTGVNVSHWLSQSEKRGEERREYIQKADFDSIAAMGFDHVRLPLDEEQLWAEDGQKEAEAFELMHNAIGWALDAKLRVIVDLHIIRSHHFISETNTLWTDPAEQQRLIDLWMELSSELKDYPNDKVAYEIMNEAVAEDPDDWNDLVNRAVSEIRKNEPERVIVIGSNMWQTSATFPDLKVPENDKNILLSFHFYDPNALTHHTASWTPTAEYDGPVNYPGWIVDTVNYTGMSDKAREAMERFANGYFDKAVLKKIMDPAIEKAKKLGLPLFCGEFGIYPAIPEEIALRWYKDVCAIFNENGIAYCHWAYKGDFPIVQEDDSRKAALVEVLTAK